MEPLPRIGVRVVLRRLSREDLARFQCYRHEEGLGRFQGWSTQSDSDAMAFIDEMRGATLFRPGQWVQLAVAEKEGNALIGDVGLHLSADATEAEVGCTLSTRAQGQGLATEAVREAVALLFERTSVSRVLGITDARNGASIRLLERLGMRRVETRNTVFRGEPCVEHVYALTRHDG
jgi:[ribosomal protein S5]-alanine N-acetyltransferase